MNNLSYNTLINLDEDSIINKLKIMKISDEKIELCIHSDNKKDELIKLINEFEDIFINDNTENIKKYFQLLFQLIMIIFIKFPFFLSQSDFIKKEQKLRFINIFKNTSSTNIKFTTDEINKILNLFINDNNLTSNFTNKYINNINTILSQLVNKDKLNTTIPKEWKCTSTVSELLKSYLTKNDTNISLLLHNNLFINNKDNLSWI